MKRLQQFLNKKQRKVDLIVIVMCNQYFIFTLFFFLFFFIFSIFHFTSVLSTDDEFFSIVPEDYYDPQDYGEESIVTNQLQENNTSDENTLPITNTYPFNIAITADWGCEKDTKKPQKIFKRKIPNLLLEQEI
jgi:hypothetical protein